MNNVLVKGLQEDCDWFREELEKALARIAELEAELKRRTK